MIALCDVNIWVALTVEPHVHHALVRHWFDRVDPVSKLLFCRATQQSFLRLLTSERIIGPYGVPALTNEAAWAAYDALAADARVGFREEPPGLEEQWREYASRRLASPNLWMDAYLAAFARQHDCQFVTTDRAFRQFPSLDVLVLGAN